MPNFTIFDFSFARSKCLNQSSLPPSHSAPDVLMLCRGGTVKISHDWIEWYMIGDGEDGFVVMIFVGGLVLILTIGGTRHKDE